MQYVILILIGIIIFIGWIISSISDSIRSARNSSEARAKRRAKWSGRTFDKTKSLGERNADIIRQHLNKLHTGGTRWHYLDDAVRDCVQDIAEAEDNATMMPHYSYLSRWLDRATPEYKELALSIKQQFQQRLNHLEREAQEKKERADQESLESLKQRHAHLIEQFLEVAERKVSLRDDYGEEQWDTLNNEVDIVMRKIMLKEGHTDNELRDWKKHSWGRPEEFAKLQGYLHDTFMKHHEATKNERVTTVDYNGMSGVAFESYLAKVLEQHGFEDVRGTPTTGDQGADLIARRDGKTFVIQAKRYEASVGNKAVQEVASAVSFYKADIGWVVTNSTFTKSAKELAQRTGIRLIDGHDLKDLTKTFGQSIA